MYLKRLRELTEDRDKKQVEIAAVLGMKQPQYARYEKGIRDLPLDSLVILSQYYEVSTDYILELTNESTSYKINKNLIISNRKGKNFLRN